MSALSSAQYLCAMGVDRYRPRWPLVNAKESPQRDEQIHTGAGIAATSEAVSPQPTGGPTGALTPHTSESVAPSAAARDQARARAKAELAPTAEGKTKPPLVTAAGAAGAASHVESPKESIKLNLTFVEGGPGVMVVDSGRTPEQTLVTFTENLLQAMITAGLHDVEDGRERCQASTFNWPPKAKLAIAQDEAATREAVHARIGRSQQNRPLRWLILMGEQTERFASFELAGCQRIKTADAAKTLNSAEFKRELWQQIKAAHAQDGSNVPREVPN